MIISIRNFIKDEANGTLTGTYLVGLTGMRGLAAIWVMLFHIYGIANKPPLTINMLGLHIDLKFLLSAGWVGVDIFFVLSGFLLGLPFIDWLNGKRDRPMTVEFYKRRCLRVLPAFYAQLIILLILGYIGWYAIASQASTWTWLLHFLMLHNISRSTGSAINGVYWTLPVEFGFYLLLPWFSYFFLRRIPNKLSAWLVLLTGIMLLVIAYRYMVFHFISERPRSNLVWALGQLPGVFDQFLFGIFSAFIYRRFNLERDSRHLTILSNYLFIIGAGGTLLMMYIISKNVGYWRGAYGLLFYWHPITAMFIGIWVLAVAMRGSISQKIFEIKPVIFLGIISYSLYLWHLPVLYKLKEYLISSQVNIDMLPWLLFSIGFILVIFISVLSYMVVERPFLKIRHHQTKPKHLL